MWELNYKHYMIEVTILNIPWCVDNTLSTFFWYHWFTSVLESLAQTQSWIPELQTGLTLPCIIWFYCGLTARNCIQATNTFSWIWCWAHHVFLYYTLSTVTWQQESYQYILLYWHTELVCHWWRLVVKSSRLFFFDGGWWTWWQHMMLYCWVDWANKVYKLHCSDNLRFESK
jgi:hypothetical protein